MTRGGEWSVEQGPRWLAELLVAPPWWLLAIVAGLSIGSLGLAAYVLHRDGVDAEVQAEMLSNGVTAGSCLLGTVAAVRVLNVTYVGDVAIGALVGLAVATYAPAASRRFVQEAIADAE